MAGPTDPADVDANQVAQAYPGQALAETASGNVQVTPSGGNSTQTNTLSPTQIQSVAANQNQINAETAATNNETTTISNLLKSIQAEEQANAPGVAPSLNLNALNAQAQSQAASTVNPLYTQYLNQYLQEQAANSTAAGSQNTLNLQGEQSSLQNTLQQNQLGENAAASTNALTQGNINVQQQNYQLTTGNAQNAKIQAIGQQIGSGNIGASGLGQQQLYSAENARNTADAAQSGQFQYQRNTSNLSTADTFAQLAQSSQYATTQEGQEETQTNFNLNDYLRQAAYNDSQYQEALSTAQQQALTAQTQQDESTLVQNQLAALNPTGSKNYAAGESAYSNVLNPSESLPTAPNASDYLNSYGASV